MGEIVIRAIILLLQLLILLYIIFRNINSGYFYKGISAGIVAYYTVFPLIVIFVYVFGGAVLRSEIEEKKLLSYIISADVISMIILGILIILFELLFSYAYTSKIRIIFGDYNRNKEINRETKESALGTLSLVGNIALFIGGVCTLYYVLSFGSISRALRLSGYVRSFTVNSTKYVSYIASIMIIPAGVVVLAPWCFLLGLDYVGGTWKKVKLFVSIILSILLLLVKAGKAPLLVFIVSFFMPLLIKRAKHPWIVLILVATFGMPIIDLLDAFFDNATILEGYHFTNYLAQFSYPYRTALNAFDIIRIYGIRWGQDFITPFIGLIPGLNFDSTWRIVSEYIAGTGWQTVGSTPTDLITFCLMEFHLPGLLLSMIMGLLCRNLDRGLISLANNAIKSEYGINALSSFCLLNGFWFVSTADFESLVRNIFFLGTCTLILFITKSRRKDVSFH